MVQDYITVESLPPKPYTYTFIEHNHLGALPWDLGVTCKGYCFEIKAVILDGLGYILLEPVQFG